MPIAALIRSITKMYGSGTRGSGKFVKRLLHPQASNQHVRYRQGPDVDSSGTMPDGRKFADIRDYKRLLLEDQESMARSLTSLLLTYSLGRQLVA